MLISVLIYLFVLLVIIVLTDLLFNALLDHMVMFMVCLHLSVLVLVYMVIFVRTDLLPLMLMIVVMLLSIVPLVQLSLFLLMMVIIQVLFISMRRIVSNSGFALLDPIVSTVPFFPVLLAYMD